jgi:hypothetical protein
VRGDGDGRVAVLGVGLGGAAGDHRRRRARVFARGSGAGVVARGRAADGLGADLLGRRLAFAAVQAAASVMSLLVRYRRPSSNRRW